MTVWTEYNLHVCTQASLSKKVFSTVAECCGSCHGVLHADTLAASFRQQTQKMPHIELLAIDQEDEQTTTKYHLDVEHCRNGGKTRLCCVHGSVDRQGFPWWMPACGSCGQ